MEVSVISVSIEILINIHEVEHEEIWEDQEKRNNCNNQAAIN